MTIRIPERVKQFIDAQRVARLATVDSAGHPFVIPICYVREATFLYSAIDQKPKRVAPRQLQRVRNIEGNPNVALLIDEYADDWTDLAYVLIHGTAAILEPGGATAAEHARAVAALQQKYPQYRAMGVVLNPVIRIEARRARAWSADGRIQ